MHICMYIYVYLQIAVEDVTGNGLLEMIAVDRNGNVLCFNKAAETVSMLGFRDVLTLL